MKSNYVLAKVFKRQEEKVLFDYMTQIVDTVLEQDIINYDKNQKRLNMDRNYEEGIQEDVNGSPFKQKKHTV